MKTIAYAFAYNERRLMPWFHNWMKQQGIELFVIDNLSTDGTTEYLQEQQIRHCQVDTGGTFDLRPLLQAMHQQIHTDKPEWFIYCSIDMFFVATGMSVARMIHHAEENGYNMIRIPQYTFYHTHTPPPNPDTNIPNPFHTNFHYRYNNLYTFISKYHPEITIGADRINHPKPEVLMPQNMAILEMNAAKTIEERIQTFRRREKAWQQGLEKNYGYHYRQLAEHGFVFSPEQQTDIRTIPQLYTLHRKLQTIPNPCNP